MLLNPCKHIIIITLNGISHSQHHISILKDTRGALKLSSMRAGCSLAQSDELCFGQCKFFTTLRQSRESQFLEGA